MPWFFDYLRGQLILIDGFQAVTPPPTDGDWIFTDTTFFNFVDGTAINFIT